MTRRRVVVTGLGLICPVGNNVEEGWASLVAGRSGIADVTKFDASALSVHFAGEVKGFNIEDYIPGKEARHMDTFIHYGMAASMQAVRDSGIATNDALDEASAERMVWKNADRPRGAARRNRSGSTLDTARRSAIA